MMQSGINNIADIPMNKPSACSLQRNLASFASSRVWHRAAEYMDNDKILMSEALFEFLTRVILINYPAGRECEKTVHIKNSLIT